jgi:phosphocarrier protein HPr
MSTEDHAEGEFTVQSELGLHARPAGRFVALAGRFESEVEVSRGQEWVSGTSVLSILSLAAAQGTVIKVKAVGVDAQRAVAELGALIEAVDEGQ